MKQGKLTKRIFKEPEPKEVVAETTSEFGDIKACIDYQSRTCIQLERSGPTVFYMPLDLDGFKVRRMAATLFDVTYQPIPGYPIKQACEHYLSYAHHYGAEDEALDWLGKVISISPKEREMATKKRAEKIAVRSGVSGGAEKKVPGEKKATAANMFKTLIMEGKLTDDQIFKKVQDKFSLPDKKRAYVAWYRNNLKKSGEKPPEARA
jgi:hypothetical protein